MATRAPKGGPFVRNVVLCLVLGLISIVVVGQLTLFLRRSGRDGSAGLGGAARRASRASGATVSDELRGDAAPNGAGPSATPACASWDCRAPQQGAGVIVQEGGGPAAAQLASAAALPPPAASPAASPALAAAAAAPAEEPALAPPAHCDLASNEAAMTHTGVDYFCCNRARGAAELAAVSSANMRDFIATGGRFPIMVVTYDRAEMLDRTLTSLLAVRCVQPSDVFVVQDGAFDAVTAVAQRHGVQLHQKSASFVLRPGKPPEGGAERIAQHFRYALSYTFDAGAPSAPAVIVIEDDFLFASDFYEYFHAVAPALELDPTLWLASAWNDNGFDYLVADPHALKRTRFFPGLGWLLPRAVWKNELESGWPDVHWDHWMRDPIRHRGRDIIIPEICRDYHAGVKGTFMDTQTHNKYFGSIAMQGDSHFTWDTPEGSDAIARVLQPAHDARLTSILADPSTVHLASVDAARSFRAGVGVVWYSCPVNVEHHDQMRGIAAFFGIWHEGGRGSRLGVHEIWWLGSARLILINACENVAAGALNVYITGSVACSPLRSLRPPAAPVLGWELFQSAEARPRLPLHTAAFGAVLATPLAHLEGGEDGNGTPDGTGAAAEPPLAPLRDEHVHGGSGAAHPHAHGRFMGDLHLPAFDPRAAAAAAALLAAPYGGGGGGALPLPRFLPASVRVVRSRTRGASCTSVCKAYRDDASCSLPHMAAINDCPTLKSHFECASCSDSIGADQPAMIDSTAPANKAPGSCLVNGDPTIYSCDATYTYALRLCPCMV